MHRTIQHSKVRSQVIKVPAGLPELLSDITREVLRCQPTTECLCQFIIDYLHSLLAAREKSTIAKCMIDQSLRIVDEAISDLCVCDIPKAKAEYMCEAMEECFRRFLAQRRCEKSNNKEIIKFNVADMLDELIQKCKFTDGELKISRPVIEAAYEKFVNVYLTTKDSSEGRDSLYQYLRELELTRIDQKMKTDAAVKIQSLFRGFLQRKSLFMDKAERPTDLNVTLPTENDEERAQEMAAVKIQKFFRRHFSIIQDSNAEKNAINPQDSCTPSSDISLTARPPRKYDINEGDLRVNDQYNQVKDNETQKKATLENQNEISGDINVDEDDVVVSKNLVTENVADIKAEAITDNGPTMKDGSLMEVGSVTADDYVTKDDTIIADDDASEDDPNKTLQI